MRHRVVAVIVRFGPVQVPVQQCLGQASQRLLFQFVMIQLVSGNTEPDDRSESPAHQTDKSDQAQLRMNHRTIVKQLLISVKNLEGTGSPTARRRCRSACSS